MKLPHTRFVSDGSIARLYIKARFPQFGEHYIAINDNVDTGNAEHKLITAEEAAAVVRRIFALCAAGNGPSQIARILRREQVLYPAMLSTSSSSGKS